jgi:hypothetical protein
MVRFDAYRANNVGMGEPGLTTIREHLARLGVQNLDRELLALVRRGREANRYFQLEHTHEAGGG